MIDHAGGGGPVVIHEPACRDAAALVFHAVEVLALLTGIIENAVGHGITIHVVDKATVFRRKADQANGKVIADGNIGHGTEVIAVIHIRTVLIGDIDKRIEGRGVRLVGDDSQQAGLGISAIERSLRPAQCLHPLDINPPSPAKK